MTDKREKDFQNERKSNQDRLSGLANQGQIWKFAKQETSFERPKAIFDQPLEITINMLRGLRMVDETIIVHGNIKPLDSNQED